jgi:hypothetical protein
MATDEPTWFRNDLEPDVDAAERAVLWRVADVLIAARPYPRAAFRAALRQSLRGSQSPTAFERPRALWARVAALGLPGLVLLGLVAVGVAGSGPFAA